MKIYDKKRNLIEKIENLKDIMEDFVMKYIIKIYKIK